MTEKPQDKFLFAIDIALDLDAPCVYDLYREGKHVGSFKLTEKISMAGVGPVKDERVVEIVLAAVWQQPEQKTQEQEDMQ